MGSELIGWSAMGQDDRRLREKSGKVRLGVRVLLENPTDSARTRLRNFGQRLLEWIERTVPAPVAAQLQFFRHHGRLPNLRRPRSFSDLVLYRLLKESNPRFTMLADKIRAKSIVSEALGSEWIIPSLWEGDHLPDVSARVWPLPYVIKAAHGSGWNLFIREAPVWDDVEKAVSSWLNSSYALHCGEWFYDAIPRRILVEPLLGNPAELPTDIKLFCFGGRVEYIMLHSERHKVLKVAVLDRYWNLLPVQYTYERPSITPDRPLNLHRIIAAAEELSADFEFVRMDFYEIDGQPLFGEYTFTPGAGLEVFSPYAYNLEFGAKWLAAKRRVRDSLN